MAEPHDRDSQMGRAAVLQAAVFASVNLLHDDSLSLLVPALRWHRLGHVDRPILLPFKAESTDLITWYACAPTPAAARALAQELVAFLGPTHVQFAATDRTPDAADAHMQGPIEASGWDAVRFSALGVKDEVAIEQQWGRLWRLLARRPASAAHIPQTFAQVRASFDRALAALNEAAALAALAAMRERFGLSAENRLFLDIRCAAAFRRWEEIVNHRLLHTVVHLRLPPETYGDVMEALYEAQLAPFERAPEVENLLDRFRETMAETARPLFRTRRTARRPTVLKAFVLFELIQAEPQAQACAVLLNQLPLGAFGALDGAVRAWVSRLASVDDYRVAQAAMELEQFDRAYELLWPLPDDVSTLQGLTLCARESEDPLKAAAVLFRLTHASAEIREGVEKLAPVRLSKLRLLAERHRPNSSATVSEQIPRFETESADDYVERWRELARAIDSNAVLADPAVPRVAAECLTSMVLDQPELFERLHPLWHEFFVDRLDPDRRLIPVYMALLETLRVRGGFTDTDRTLLSQTLMALVMAGPDQTTYRTGIDEVHEIFKEVRSPHTLGWALEICDGLAVAPTRDQDARLRLLLSVQQAAMDFRARLPAIERALLKLLVTEADLPFPSELNVERGTDDATAAQTLTMVHLVGLYSLNEAATKRATQLLVEVFPHLKVESSADMVCTPRLKSLAQQADIFVFAWKSSKHAAFDCVKAAIREKDRLVMARGAGTTSLVEAACQHLR